MIIFTADITDSDHPTRALFYTDSLSLCCTSVQVEKQWWVGVFECKETEVPADWDCALPSDVALKLPGGDGPTILLSDKAEAEHAGYECRNEHPMIFCTNLKKAQEQLRRRGGAPGPIQHAGGTSFFELSDPEGNVIEICKEP